MFCLVVLYSLVCIILALVLSPRPSQSYVLKIPVSYLPIPSIQPPPSIQPSIHTPYIVHTYIIAHIYTDLQRSKYRTYSLFPPTTLTYPIPASPHLPFFRRLLVIPVVFSRPPRLQPFLASALAGIGSSRGAACLAFCIRLFEAGVVHVFVSVVPCLADIRYGLGANRCYYGCICMVLWSSKEIHSHPTLLSLSLPCPRLPCRQFPRPQAVKPEAEA